MCLDLSYKLSGIDPKTAIYLLEHVVTIYIFYTMNLIVCK
jgi:hypothetical protein